MASLALTLQAGALQRHSRTSGIIAVRQSRSLVPSLVTAARRGPGSRRLGERAAAADNSPEEPKHEETFALAPSKPTSPLGQMAAYLLEMKPHLFKEAVANEFSKLQAAREAEQAAAPDVRAEVTDLVLSRRMAEVRLSEQRHSIEELMYVCILECFQEVGVRMMPAVAPIEESLDDLKALTEGVHSKEALEMVKEHVLAILGPASMAYADTRVKMSKLQAAQVYAASIMFGYFLRRVDSRFRLARSTGMLPDSREDAVTRLERLFAMADGDDGAAGGDVSSADDGEVVQAETTGPEPSTSYGGGGGAQAASGGREAEAAGPGMGPRKKGALRAYVESFDQEAMLQMARLVTIEGAALVERQTKALFGDAKALQQQMQAAVGDNVTSVEDLMQRVQKAVADDKVESVVVTVGTQRRAVLEAVAYGCFLRDVEGWVDSEFQLLTPVGAAANGGGMMGDDDL